MPTLLFFLREAADFEQVLPLWCRLKLLLTSRLVGRLLLAHSSDKWASDKAWAVAEQLLVWGNHAFGPPASTLFVDHRLSLHPVPGCTCYSFAFGTISALLDYKQRPSTQPDRTTWEPEFSHWSIRNGIAWCDHIPERSVRWRVGEPTSYSTKNGVSVAQFVRVYCTVTSGKLSGVRLEATGEAYVPRRMLEAHLADGAAQRVSTHINMLQLRVHARGATLPD